MMVYCLVDIHAVQTVTSDFAVSYPFYIWPGNETVGGGKTELTLLCVVHGCNHGPVLVVGDQLYFPSEDCKVGSNQSRKEGIWIQWMFIYNQWMFIYNEWMLGLST